MIRKAGKDDLETLSNLAAMLWDSHSADELIAEFSETVSSDKSQFFLKYADGLPVGFAQCQLRCDYVEGTSTSPVGYLEGVFIQEAYRRRGFAKELLAACEAWAKEQGCREFASDCEIENTESFRFHQAMHFTEANRIICFTKAL